MRLTESQLRAVINQVIREEAAHLHEAGKPTAIVATVPQADVSKWDEAAKAMKIKSSLKFVPGANGVDIVFQGYGTPSETKKRAEVWGRKLQKMIGNTTSSEQPVDDAKVLALLSNVFTSTVTAEDVPLIRFQQMKDAVRMIDVDGMLGNMQTAASSRELASAGLNARQLADWLGSPGARAMKPQRRTGPCPCPIGGYD